MTNGHKFDEAGHIIKSKITVIKDNDRPYENGNRPFKGYTNGQDGAYLRWLFDKINDKKCKAYSSLLIQLFETSFKEIPEVKMDVNRARDGVALRKKFLQEIGQNFDSLESPDCSWLEMLIALSERIDDQMMYDMNLGNRTSQWFWLIIDQMDLKRFTNTNYNFDAVAEKLKKYGERQYENGGKNGIFKCRTDVRKTEIWYQMMHFFNEIGTNVDF